MRRSHSLVFWLFFLTFISSCSHNSEVSKFIEGVESSGGTGGDNETGRTSGIHEGSDTGVRDVSTKDSTELESGATNSTDSGDGVVSPSVTTRREFSTRLVVAEPSTVNIATSDLVSTLFYVGHRFDGTSLYKLDLKAGLPEAVVLNDSGQADAVTVGGGSVYTMTDAARTIGSNSLFDAAFVRLEEEPRFVSLDSYALVGTAAADGDHAYWAGLSDDNSEVLIKRVSHSGGEDAVEVVATQPAVPFPQKVQLTVSGGRVYFGLDLNNGGSLYTLDTRSDYGGVTKVPGLSDWDILEIAALKPELVYFIGRKGDGIAKLLRLTGDSLTEIHTAKSEGPGPTLRDLTYADDFVYVLDAPSNTPCVSGDTGGEVIYAASISPAETAQVAGSAFCAQALAAVKGSVYYFDGTNIQEISVR